MAGMTAQKISVGIEASSIHDLYAMRIFHLDPSLSLLLPRLILVLISLVVDNVEESELVNTLGGRNNSEPVSQLLLLEELLCPIDITLAFKQSNTPLSVW